MIVGWILGSLLITCGPNCHEYVNMISVNALTFLLN